MRGALGSRPQPGSSRDWRLRRFDAIALHCPRYTPAVAAHFDVSIRACAITLLLLVAGACAHSQTFQIDCIPRDVTIFLDGEPLERNPREITVFVDGAPVDRVSDSIDLRSDRPHVLFIKGEGYEPTMVVLDTEETGAGPVLSPRDLCLGLNLNKRSRKLEIEVEE